MRRRSTERSQNTPSHALACAGCAERLISNFHIVLPHCANMIVQSKQNEAKEEAKRRAQQIDKQKSEAKKMDGFGSGGMGSMGGMGGSSMGGAKDVSSYEQSYSRPVQNEPPPKPSKPMMKGKGALRPRPPAITRRQQPQPPNLIQPWPTETSRYQAHTLERRPPASMRL